jgi:hypothetical protein
MPFSNSRRLSFGIMMATLLAWAGDGHDIREASPKLLASRSLQRRLGLALALAASTFGVRMASATPPFAVVSHDLFINTFNGTSSTVGINQINLVGATPGYFNNLSLPAGTATGAVTITALPQGITTVAGLAVHVTDTAGPSHSLSTLNDPALADLIFDLNHSGIGGDFVVTTYAYNAAPPQYANAEAALSAGEAALGGQPFDLLLTGANSFPPIGTRMYWSMDFSPVIGITAIGMTDVGAVPEPTGAAMLGLLAAPALLARRRRR